MKNHHAEDGLRRHERRQHHDHVVHDSDHEHGAAHSHNGDPTGGRHTHTHMHTNTKAVLNRLSKLIGHLNAVKTMVESGRDCSEILIQLAAVRSAINSTMKIILKDHIDHCIVNAVETGDTETIEELNKAIEILMK
jgi:DNA-binding FrmR family transcriptional regulator